MSVRVSVVLSTLVLLAVVGCSGGTSASPTPQVSLPWWEMGAAEYQGINSKAEQWITESLGYELEFDTSPELRASACVAWSQLGYNPNGLDEHGRRLVAQGIMIPAEWNEVAVVMRSMEGALVGRYMDSYMEARRAGRTPLPPGQTFLGAYCALGPNLG